CRGAQQIDLKARLLVDLGAKLGGAARERHPDESPQDQRRGDHRAGREHDALARRAAQEPVFHRDTPVSTICTRPSTVLPSGFAKRMRASKRSLLSISRVNASSEGTSGTTS